MRKLFVSGVAAALALALAVPAVAKPKWAGPPSDLDIVETVIDLSGATGFDTDGTDFDILREAVLATDGDYGTAELLSGDDDYTVFAPTDDAFVALAEALSGDAGLTEEEAFATVAGLGLPTVFDVLAYHVTDGSRPSPSVVNATGITMLDGQRIAFVDGELTGIGSAGGFVDTDVRVDNGMIHVIDFVLLPF
jgi:uncharacterized surface protein with fasciclin (FAS1) repeats